MPRTVNYPVNFKLQQSVKLEILTLSVLNNALIVQFSNMAHLNIFYQYFTRKTTDFEFLIDDGMREVLTPIKFSKPVIMPNFSLGLTQTTPILLPDQIIDLTTSDTLLSNSEKFYTIPHDYLGSVETINPKYENLEGALESSVILLTGRWSSVVPVLTANARYPATILVEGYEWTKGAFKYTPRPVSRLGLNNYFGVPLLGLFDFNEGKDITAYNGLA